MRRLILICAIAASMSGMLFTASVSAQVVPSSLVGERVRVTPRQNLRSLTGRVMQIAEGHLVLADEAGEPTRVALSEVERLELSLGSRGNVGRGAWIGALAGAGVGAALWAAAFAGERESDVISNEEAAAILTVGGTVAGALVGLGIGALVKSERWTDVPRQRWSLSVGAGKGIEVGFRFTL